MMMAQKLAHFTKSRVTSIEHCVSQCQMQLVKVWHARTAHVSTHSEMCTAHMHAHLLLRLLEPSNHVLPEALRSQAKSM